MLFQIIDEKSLIKKYQREIAILKQELDHFKKGMPTGVNQEEIMSLRQQVWCAFFYFWMDNCTSYRGSPY